MTQNSSTLDLPPDILTHDQRVRVFVSSTLEELAPERRAACAAIKRLRLTPVMFELGARPHPPRQLYRSYLAQSDVFIGIYGDRYGWVAPESDISGLEDEYRLSDSMPRLMYVKAPAPDREPRLMTMIEDIWAHAGTSTTPYADATELEERIADDLAVLLTERFAATRSASTALHPEPLPVPLTPLLGRDAELGEVLGLLRRPETRLVTITGPGGIGKTRLALEAAAKVALPGEVCFVDLSSVQDAALVPSAIAVALDMRLEGTRAALDVLADRLATQPMLLVLDNFEQVSAAAREVVRLLTSAPGVRALVTSRRVLRVRGEHEVTLSPLLTPPDMDANAAAVATFPAVRVFVNRARQARPDFAITDDNAQNVADIVRRLEGIPLALELAAARVRLLSAQALLQRLDRPLDLSSHDVDAPTRQQTLRRTIAWSFDLLDGPERALMSRLAVFVGGWSLDGAEAMCRGDTAFDVLETLSFLVEHSLVTADDRPYGEPRFRMLETVRDYAVEQLWQAGEYDDAMRRLSGYVCEVVRSFADSADGDGRRRASERMDAELDSIRAVLRWAVEQDDAELVLSIAAPAYRYWWRHGLLREMLDIADRTSTLPSSARLSPRLATLLLWTRGTIRIALGRTQEAVPMLQAAADDAKGLDDDWVRAQSLFSLAITLPQEDAAQMRAMLEEALALFRTLDDGWSIALALTPLGDLALLEGDVPRGTAMHEEALQLAERIDDHYMRAQSLDQLALDAMLAGDVVLARSRLTAAAELHRQVRDQEGLAYCLDGLAGVALASGRTNIAAQLVGAADRIRRIEGLAVWPLMAPLSDQLRQGIAMVLGDGPYAEEHERGAALDPLDALDLGLRDG
jgi:predicted ATPase